MTSITSIIVGCGAIGRVHATIHHHHPGVELVGLVDQDPALAAALAESTAPGTPCAGDLTELPPADLVVVAVPTGFHEATVAAALATGAKVLCEKPVALDLAAAERIRLAAESAGAWVAVGQCLRFWPQYDVLRAALRDERLGALRSLALWRLGAWPGGPDHWLRDPERSGGAALDFHVHDVDMVHACCGMPARVSARGDHQHIVVDYAFDHLDAVVTSEGGWDHPAGFPFSMGYRAVFEHAAVHFDSSRDPDLTWCLPEGVTPPEVATVPEAVRGCPAYYRQLDHLVTCIRRGEPPRDATLAQATGSLAIALGAIASALGHHPVDLEVTA